LKFEKNSRFTFKKREKYVVYRVKEIFTVFHNMVLIFEKEEILLFKEVDDEKALSQKSKFFTMRAV